MKSEMNSHRRQLLYLTLLGVLPFPVRAGCKPTLPNSLGPFYRRDAPLRTTIADRDEPGQLLLVSGRVSGADGCTPLPGAWVDVWHANREGRYYDVGSSAGNTPEQFRLRGRMRTDENGEYAFSTVLPGTYGSRPRHIHYVVHAPGSKPLITQLYFDGDPRLGDDSLVRESLVRPLEDAGNDSLKTRFDIVLQTA